MTSNGMTILNTLQKEVKQKLWLLRILKTSEAHQTYLVDTYCIHSISILEYAALVWHSALTKESTSDIERVHKSVLGTILGTRHNGYQNSLGILNLDKLSDRRTKLCLTLTKKALNSDFFVLLVCS